MNADDVISIGIYRNKAFVKVRTQELFESIFEKHDGGMIFQEETAIQGIRKPTNLPIVEIQNEQENNFLVLRSNRNKTDQSDKKTLNEKQPTDAAMEQMNQEPK
ncbi:hypothetical protein HHI36_001157 [Cryptolaemus montrouzieri]|uniref:Uncharacterized protein n=1 Tax=Cryptolaemus montrouzieri TaxID=559131 RepID=A0ABD2P7E5_9CUCU